MGARTGIGGEERGQRALATGEGSSPGEKGALAAKGGTRAGSGGGGGGGGVPERWWQLLWHRRSGHGEAAASPELAATIAAIASAGQVQCASARPVRVSESCWWGQAFKVKVPAVR